MDHEPAGTGACPVAVPGYELFEVIGEGGMGTVYRARQLSLERTVAVKVLKAGTHEAAPVVSFQRESRLMASLSHPNLVTIYDCGRVDRRPFLVTEYVAAPTLRSLMKPGEPWPAARAAALLDRIARAISYIHERGILHLDLKPENILCTPGGEVKITDFGLALARVDAGRLAELGLARGTLEYCPPEQRFGLQTDERSDLFSLAVLAHELLTGHLPGRVYEPVRRLNPRLPARLDAVLRRGLARNPEERPGSVEEFRRRLLEPLDPGRQPRLARTVAGLAGTLLLWGLGLLFGYYGRSREAGPSPAAAPAGPVQSWVLYDRPETLPWLAADGHAESRPAPRGLLVRGQYPQGADAPDLPVWPEPRPVLVITSAGATGFVHLLDNPALGREVQGQWDALTRLPRTPPEDNLVRAGAFEGKCLALHHEDNASAWHVIDPQALHDGNDITLAAPPDRPDDPALLLAKQNPESAGQEIGCYQWLSRIPERPGTVVVLRYRARAAEGEGGRLNVRVRQPLLVPRDDPGPIAARLRGVSAPFGEMPHKPEAEAYLYVLHDWVRPTTEWRTYYTVWEWPAYCTDPYTRNIEVTSVGLGTVWVDDLELFTWQLGGRE